MPCHKSSITSNNANSNNKDADMDTKKSTWDFANSVYPGNSIYTTFCHADIKFFLLQKQKGQKAKAKAKKKLK